MHTLRIEHRVQDYDRWKQVFDSDPVNRKAAGVLRYQISRLQNDSDYVMIDLEFDSRDLAEAFVQTMLRIWDGPGKAVMRDPRARIMEVVESKEL